MAEPWKLGDVLARIALTGRSLIGAEPDAALIERARAILASDGEAVLVTRARQFLDSYLAAGPEERHGFLAAAAEELGPDRARLDAAVDRYLRRKGEVEARALHAASEPLSQELVRRLNRATGGTADLVAMREDLLSIARGNPELEALDDDFRHLFASWFNRGFLEMRQIDWQTPAAILEKITLYEAVHEIRDWTDLRRRVGAPDRQLYAFFHPAMPDDPLIFVEVALTREIPDAIGPILAEERATLEPERATTAVFYSISNCQKGLKGVSFGNFLIKTVVEELRASFPALTTFVTLSPVPGFRAWAEREGIQTGNEPPSGIERLAARYLVEEKDGRGRVLDPVARFHLGNGARLERINPKADASPRGRRQSWGLMVNYLYALGEIERNHEAFSRTGEVAHSAAVRRALRRREEA